MDMQERIGNVAMHLRELFASGTTSISRDDDMSDGSNIADEIFAALEAERLRPGTFAGHLDLQQAFEEIATTWSNGFDLADAADYVDDERTIADLVEAHFDAAPGVRL
jgi:hypothetical protein